MSVLLQRIAELERKCRSLRMQRDELRRSRDMWKLRAMQAERNRPRRRRVAA